MSMSPDIAERLSRRARTAASDEEVLARLSEIVGASNVLVDEEKVEPYAQDALKEKFPPEAVVLPRTAEEVSAILRRHRKPTLVRQTQYRRNLCRERRKRFRRYCVWRTSVGFR